MADATYTSDAAILDGTAFAANTGSLNVVGGVYNDSIGTVSSGYAGAARLTSYRALHVNLRDASGTEYPPGTQYVEDGVIPTAGTGTLVVGRRDDALATLTEVENDAVGLRVGSRGALWVQIADGSGAQITSFGGGTQYAEDTAFGGNGTGTLMVARRDDTLTTLTPVEDDAVGLRVNSRGALWVSVDFNDAVVIEGDVAHDSADGNSWPIKVGGYANNNAPTSVAVGDRVNAWFGLNGSLVVSAMSQTGAGADGQSAGYWNGPGSASSVPAGTAGHLFNGSTWDRARSGGVTGMAGIAGATAADAAIAAYPVTVGGRASAAAPTDMSADGDVVDLWLSRKGSQVVGGFLGTGADGVANTSVQWLVPSASTTPNVLAVGPWLFNGSTWDRARSAAGVTGSTAVGGLTAADAAIAAAPVTVGARASTATPTAMSADGDVVNLWASLNGALNVVLRDTGNDAIAISTAMADGESNTLNRLEVEAYGMLFNGSTWDRQRSGGVTGMAGVGGATAADSAIAANPVTTGGRASNAVPTAVSADGDVVNLWLHRTGAQVVAPAPHIGMLADPYTYTSKTAQWSTTQTGVALWTPASGKKIVVTAYQIQAGGTTAGTVQLWFGGSADTAYTRGTDLAIFDGEFAPSSTLKPGVVQTGLWISPTADYVLRVTDSAAINPLTVTVWGYEV